MSRRFIAAPVGTALWLAGGNDKRRPQQPLLRQPPPRAMLFAVPDATVCGPLIGTPVTGCSTTARRPRMQQLLRQRDGIAPTQCQTHGVDFWWDSFPGNTGNCWYRHVAAPAAPSPARPRTCPGLRRGLASRIEHRRGRRRQRGRARSPASRASRRSLSRRQQEPVAPGRSLRPGRAAHRRPRPGSRGDPQIQRRRSSTCARDRREPDMRRLRRMLPGARTFVGQTAPSRRSSRRRRPSGR